MRRSLRGLDERRTVAAVGIKFDDQSVDVSGVPTAAAWAAAAASRSAAAASASSA